MYAPEHVVAWRRIVDFVHANSKAKFCLQLGHSGPKGSTRVGWEGYDVPLESGNWPVMGASDVPWSSDNQIPVPMTRADMDRSEEHTSELQSLMRISYAVLCLKKTTARNRSTHT